MAEKFVELDEIACSENDPIVHVWGFTCSLCSEARKAYVYESGVVLDVAKGQPEEPESLQVAADGKTFVNLYLIKNVASIGAEKINQDIADLHAQAFHGLASASVTLAN